VTHEVQPAEPAVSEKQVAFLIRALLLVLFIAGLVYSLRAVILRLWN